MSVKDFMQQMKREAIRDGHAVREINGNKYSCRHSGLRVAWRYKGCKYAYAEILPMIAHDLAAHPATTNRTEGENHDS